MVINVKELSVIKDKLYKNLEEYNHSFFNYYNVLNSLQAYWKDGNSFPFFDAIEKTKKDGKTNYQFFKKIIRLYGIIIDGYGKIGNKVEYDFRYYDKVIDSILKIDNQLDFAISKYSSLNLSYLDWGLRNSIYYEVQRCRKLKSDLVEIKQKNKDIKYQIDEIEDKIGGELSKFQLNYIFDEVYDAPIRSLDSIMMDVNQIDASLGKLEMYKRDEDLIVEDIEDNLREIQYYYKSTHLNQVLEIVDGLVSNMKKINQIHYQNILKIEMHRSSYIEATGMIKSNFEKIGDEK